MRAVHAARRADAGLRALNRLMAEDVGSGAFLHQSSRPPSWGAIDSRPDARRHPRADPMVLVGEGDELTPPARAAEEIAARDPRRARLVSVPQCGSLLSTLERPREVTSALLAWLQA